MMNIFYIQRLLFLCVILLHSAEKSAGVMACQQWVYGSGAPLLDQTEQYCSAQGVDARVCPATNVGGEADGVWVQDRLNPAANELWPMLLDHPLQPTNPLYAPVEDDAWMYGSGEPLIHQTAQWHSGPVIDDRFLPGTNVGGEAGGAWMQDRLNPAANEPWPMLLDHPVQPTN
ncbi:MAG: hypothetical protein OXC30_04000, partial [Alphaproteobacteria bacterium]|nr:hypothetical protein [Alphaproteobacteria bacterium]